MLLHPHSIHRLLPRHAYVMALCRSFWCDRVGRKSRMCAYYMQRCFHKVIIDLKISQLKQNGFGFRVRHKCNIDLFSLSPIVSARSAYHNFKRKTSSLFNTIKKTHTQLDAYFVSVARQAEFDFSKIKYSERSTQKRILMGSFFLLLLARDLRYQTRQFSIQPILHDKNALNTQPLWRNKCDQNLTKSNNIRFFVLLLVELVFVGASLFTICYARCIFATQKTANEYVRTLWRFYFHTHWTRSDGGGGRLTTFPSTHPIFLELI